MHLVRGNPLRFPICVRLGYVVYVPISPPQRTLMGTHRKFGINITFQSLSIIKYLEPSKEDLFMARTLDLFNNEHFLALGGDLKYHI